MRIPEGYKALPGLEMKAQEIKNKDMSGFDKVIAFKEYLWAEHGISSGAIMEKDIKRIQSIANNWGNE